MERLKKGWIEIDINSLVKAKWNYKTEDEDKAKKLTAQIKKNGQIENIIIREYKSKYEIVNGNHRLDVFKALNYKKVMAFNLGKISDAQAKRIAIETNETKFDPDNIKLAELIKDITKEFPIDELDITMPYSKDELEGFEKLLDFDWDQFNNSEAPEFSDNEIIKIEVTKEVKEQWIKWKERCKELLGYDNEMKCFEFAIVEALNIPEQSLK